MIGVAADELPLMHEMTTLEELRAVSDPLRLMLFRLLRESEHTVKELCDLLGESSTRLYYHVGELERVGLVRLVRTEARAGIVQKYYRAAARFVTVPFSLFQNSAGSEEAQAAVDWHGFLLEQAIADLRSALGDNVQATDPETLFATRNYIRVSPEKARELAARMEAFQQEILAADDPQGTARFTYTSVLAPMSWPEPGRVNRQCRKPAHAALGADTRHSAARRRRTRPATAEER
jgi:DNA-binding transcriptional ArsR family regulator